MDQDVLWFEIPMHYTFLNQLDEPVTYLLQVSNRLFLWYSPNFVHVLPQLSPVAILLDDVVVVVALHYVEEFHDVGALQSLEDLYLGEQRIFEVLVLID